MNQIKKFYVLMTRSKSIALIVLGLSIVAGWRWLAQNVGNGLNPSDFIQVIHQLGFLGKLAYVGIMVLAIVVSPIPGTPLTVAAGTIWGSFTAAIYGTIGIFFGSLIAYYIGRTLGRSVMRTLTGKTIYLSKQRGEAYLGLVVFITHLLPVAPFDLISYGAGLSKLSFSIYAPATLFGSIPGTFLLACMGSSFIGNPAIGIVLAAIFLSLLVILPWGVHQYNWLGIKDIVRIE